MGHSLFISTKDKSDWRIYPNALSKELKDEWGKIVSFVEVKNDSGDHQLEWYIDNIDASWLEGNLLSNGEGIAFKSSSPYMAADFILWIYNKFHDDHELVTYSSDYKGTVTVSPEVTQGQIIKHLFS